ncbi:MAG: hypothetical protein SFU91_06290 [Chloroherpetonaceae bacterium]|nr:hypothetical protein [Chloroherpetonaceae bacterium]
MVELVETTASHPTKPEEVISSAARNLRLSANNTMRWPRAVETTWLKRENLHIQ